MIHRRRIQRHCSRCGGRMERTFSSDRFTSDDRFDRRTGKPAQRWFWACVQWIEGSGLLVNADHDHRRVKAPRRRLTEREQWQIRWSS